MSSFLNDFNAENIEQDPSDSIPDYRLTSKKLLCPNCVESVSDVKYYIDEETNERQYYCDNCSFEAPKEDFQH